eukprot:CAMPEP_0117620544 /NCGR_PEP_ID=MMETSP0784-20121206/87181_1 /TAXON_ID=39447 /ORGANISM="" /LENGTH=218 /DNA_ID=CAMNT_0005424457 /DNA_START=15 /DNA_END=667 /DNA_ORIENTATION=+
MFDGGPIKGLVAKDHVEARQIRHQVLQDAVRCIMIWAFVAAVLALVAWAMAHFTVSRTLPRWAVAGPWAVLVAAPVWYSERALQRTAMGLRLKGVASDGPMRLCGATPVPAQMPLPTVPGAPWFGPSRRWRSAAAVATGITTAALEWHVAPLAAAIAGSVVPFLLLLRGCHAALWVCDWRLTQLWRKRKGSERRLSARCRHRDAARYRRGCVSEFAMG